MCMVAMILNRSRKHTQTEIFQLSPTILMATHLRSPPPLFQWPGRPEVIREGACQKRNPDPSQHYPECQRSGWLDQQLIKSVCHAAPKSNCPACRVLRPGARWHRARPAWLTRRPRRAGPFRSLCRRARLTSVGCGPHQSQPPDLTLPCQKAPKNLPG